MFTTNRPIKAAVGFSFMLLLASCQTKNNSMNEDSQVRTLPPAKTTEGTVSKSSVESRPLAPNAKIFLKNDKNQKIAEIQPAEKGGKANREAAAISSFELSGAMAARSKNKAWTASINWVQQGQSNYQIRLMGPIGSGTVLIQKQGGVVSFKDGSKKATSSNADQLLVQQTGIRLPVSNLYYWVRGLPAPGGVQSEKRDAANHLVALKQDGYLIEFAGYSSVSKAALPTNIKLQGQGVTIKLIIKRWRA